MEEFNWVIFAISWAIVYNFSGSAYRALKRVIKRRSQAKQNQRIIKKVVGRKVVDVVVDEDRQPVLKNKKSFLDKLLDPK